MHYIGLVQGGIKCANQQMGFIDSEDPKHTLFCLETAFVAVYRLFQGQYSPPLIEIRIKLQYL